MSKSPNDHQKVVSFIKEYRPLPPPGTVTLESQLISKISQKSSDYHSSNNLRKWLMFTALITSGAAIVAGYRSFEPSYQLTENTAELETFMVETWQGTMKESSLYSDWAIIENPHRPYLVSSP